MKVILVIIYKFLKYSEMILVLKVKIAINMQKHSYYINIKALSPLMELKDWYF